MINSAYPKTDCLGANHRACQKNTPTLGPSPTTWSELPVLRSEQGNNAHMNLNNAFK